ncbi:lipopolysaccharide biosynthesis protein [Lactiplantibacillus plantarum]|uniref:oligosaccharide flippase family protein n=1 Tax=Lactiplantibacillus plantarum TaxID=1590 RepID=UPI0021A5D681|nr:oligosaccharide flippase family protein [Lactiplantibacillus plantarum]MCT3247371.1 lipopolysaccharide biosynthesis protein [Lactiplantibacillus plantarum]
MGNKLKEGFLFTTLAQIVNVVSVLLINIILSHKLTPADFGIITLVQVIATFMNLFTSEAVPSALIQNKKLANNDYGILFNFSLILGMMATVIFIGIGYIIAMLYNNTIYIPITYAMSILVLASFANCVPQGLFLKGLNFKALSLRRIISSFLGLISGIIGVYSGIGMYAIILTLVVPVVFTLIFNLLYIKIPFTNKLDFRPLRIISLYLVEQTKFSLLNYGYRNVDNILIGKFLGPASLGYYSKSYQLLSQPITLFLGIITPVLQPVLSKYEGNFVYLKNFYLKITQVIAFLAIPLSLFFSINSKEIIYFLFGRQWTGAILPMSLLSISIWVQLLTQVITPIWQSANFPKLQTRNGEISFGLIFFCIIIGLFSHSIIFVAAAVSIAYYVNFVISAKMLLKFALKSNLNELVRILEAPIFSGIVNLATLLVLKYFISFESLFLTLVFRGVFWLLEVYIYLLVTGNLKKIISIF